MPRPRNRNAFAGSNIEKLFCNSVGDHPSVTKEIQDKFGIDAPYLNSVPTGIHGEKCDVKMSFGGRNVDANIKGYRSDSAMFNQATRMSLEKFGQVFNIKDQHISEIRELFRLKAKNPKKEELIPPTQRSKWREILKPHAKEIIKYSMSSHPSREILVLYDRTKYVMRIYKMLDVLKKLDYDISYTPLGNIKIGECFQLQRKGGDGNVRKFPKTDPRHPSNHVQIKMDIRKFLRRRELGPFITYEI